MAGFSAGFCLDGAMKEPTQGKIAKRLGLSCATVSRVLRNIPGSNSKTVVRVIETARAMGYRLPVTESSSARKGVARRRSKELGVMISVVEERLPDLNTDVPLRILHGVTAAARQHGVSLHVEYVPREIGAGRPLSRRDIPAALRRPQVSGVLLIADLPPQMISVMADCKPCVGLGFHQTDPAMDFVGQDDIEAVAEAVKRLKKLGHRKIGYYCKGLDSSFSRSRFIGYTGALAIEGLPYDPDYAVNIRNRLGNDGLDQVMKGVSCGVRAWICAHDGWGYEVIRYLQQKGLSVPGDVSVCGFDHLHVPDRSVGLMSVEWPLEDMGAAGIELLIRRINEPARAASQVLFSGRLVEGRSAGSAPDV
jgi:LacI family transcriptional regulator